MSSREFELLARLLTTQAVLMQRLCRPCLYHYLPALHVNSLRTPGCTPLQKICAVLYCCMWCCAIASPLSNNQQASISYRAKISQFSRFQYLSCLLTFNKSSMLRRAVFHLFTPHAYYLAMLKKNKMAI